MPEKFDPLKAWLGITSSGKPSYYDLIGLANFESEPPIIAEAADSAIAKVSENLGGEHHAIAEKLVRDLKSLKAVLLSAEKRRTYDEQLSAKLGVAPPQSAAPFGSQGIDAADSPTMMLPPGALSALRGLDQVLGAAPPSGMGSLPPAPGYGAQPGYPPGAMPAPGFGAPGYGAPQGAPQPYGAPQQYGAPAFGGPQYGAPHPNAPYGDPQYGAPQQPYGAPAAHGPNPYQQPQYGADPNAGFNQNSGYPNPGFGGQPGPQQPMYPGPMGPGQMGPGQMNPGMTGPGQMGPGQMGPSNPFDVAQPTGNPFAGGPFSAVKSGGPAYVAPVSGGVNLGLGGPSPLPGEPMGFGASSAVGTMPRPSTMPKARSKALAPKSQVSNVTVALGVLGAAGVALAIVIVVVQKYRANEVAAVPIQTKPREFKQIPPTPPSIGVPLRTPFEAGPTNPGNGRRPGDDVPVSVDVSKEMDPRERRNMAMNPDTLVPMLTGGTPIGGTPTPSGTAPMNTTTGAAKPAAMPKEPLAGADGMKGVVVAQVPMEPSLPEDATRAKSVPTMLKGSRGSLRAREYNKAEETILLAQITADTPALVKRAQEHARALDLLRSFWTSVRDGIKKLKAGDELTFGGKTATVIKHDDTSLVVKLDGKDIPLSVDKLVPALAVQLAERSLGTEAPGAKLIVGTFLAIDQGADTARGFELIEASAGGDIIVEDFINVLKSTD